MWRILGIIMIEKGKEIFFKYKETIMYLIMGVATTIVNWASYAIFIRVLSGAEHKVFISNTIAWVLGVIFAYVTNKIFVFESYNWELKYVVKEVFLFVSARAITGLIEIVGVPFLVDTLKFDAELFGTKGMMAKVCISVIVIILNYVFSKLFVFKKETVEDNENE